MYLDNLISNFVEYSKGMFLAEEVKADGYLSSILYSKFNFDVKHWR